MNNPLNYEYSQEKQETKTNLEEMMMMQKKSYLGRKTGVEFENSRKY